MTCSDTALLQGAQHLSLLAQHYPDARLWVHMPTQADAPALAPLLEALRAAEGLAVHDSASAQALRRLGWRGPILLLAGVADARALELCSRLGLWQVLHSAEQLDWLAAHKSQHSQQVLLRGGPGGFAAQQLGSTLARLAHLPQVENVTVWAQAPTLEAAPALAAALADASAAWAGARNLVVPVALGAALAPATWEHLSALQTLAHDQQWALELLCTP